MELENLLYIVDDPNRIAENDVDMLEDVLGDYPYFQIAHVLVAKGTHNKRNVLTSQKIRKAAAYTYSRSTLRKIIENQIEHIDISAYKEQERKDLETQHQNTTINDSWLNQPSSNEENQQNITEAETSTFETTLIEPSEALAMRYFNAGKIPEAIQVYQKLIETYPENASYFEGQIGILKGEEILNKKVDIDPETPSFFDTMHEDVQTEPLVQDTPEEIFKEPESFIEAIQDPQPLADTTHDNLPELDDFHVSESLALSLYNKGSLQESIEVYQKLLQKYPEREYYYMNQIHVLQEELGEKSSSSAQSNTQETPVMDTFNEIKEQKEETIQELTNTAPEEINPVSDHFFEQINTEEKNPLEEVKPFEIEEKTSTETSFFDNVFKEEEKETPHDAFSKIEDFISTEEGSFFENLDYQEVSEKIPTEIKTSNLLNEVNEDAAMQYYNEGNTQKALEIYKKLILSHPEKESYYLNQISILTGSIEDLNPTVTDNPGQIKDIYAMEENNFMESSESEEKNTIFAGQNDELSESTAMGLFNEGKVNEAVAVYHQLIQKYPERRDYFLMQIEVLTS